MKAIQKFTLLAAVLAPGLVYASSDCKLTSGIVGIGKYCQTDLSRTTGKEANAVKPAANSKSEMAKIQSEQGKGSVAPTVAGASVQSSAIQKDGPTATKEAMASVKGAADTKANAFSPLTIHAGQRMSHALSTWLSAQAISLSWEAQGVLPGRIRDVQLESQWSSSGNTVEDVLQELLTPFGLQAQTFAATAASGKVVVIRNVVISRP